VAYTYQGKLDEAAALGEAVLPSLRQHPGDAAEVTQSMMYHLAQTWADQLRLAEADSLYTELSAILDRELGPDHPRTLGARSAHGWLHRMAGRLDEAEAFTASALAGQRRVLGNDHNETLVSVNNLAVIYKDLGRFDEAEPLYRENLESGVRLLGEAHPENLPAMVNLAAFYQAQERWDDAQRTADRAVAVFTDVMPEGHIGVALARMTRGLSLLELGRPVAAEADLLAAHAVMGGLFGSDHRHVRNVCTKLAEIYDSLGRSGEAARWRARAAEG
jgi:tetratricopeptide (TPR) repeat protein